MSEEIFIISGESSGEMYGASLIKELKKINPTLKITGVGSSNFVSAGANLLFDYTEVNYIGFSAIIKNIVKLKKKLKQCIDYIRIYNPAIVVLIDFPGFNLKLIKEVRKFYNGKIVYYISPQLWAWHKDRIKIIKENVNKLLVIFPFEVDFYKSENLIAEYVGHPLKERTDLFLKNENYPVSKTETRVLTLMPGSRLEEVQRILPVLIESATKLQKEFNLNINILCSGNIPREIYLNILNGKQFSLIYDDGTKSTEFKTIYYSDLLFTKSGTSTVECALLKSPFCIVYRTSVINYFIGKNIIKLKNIGMVNILLGENAVKEFVQGDCNEENIYKEGKRILTDKEYKEEMIKRFEKLDIILGDNKTSEIAAKSIYKLIE